jgi:hypothetical protein
MHKKLVYSHSNTYWLDERNKAIFEEPNSSIHALFYKTMTLQNRSILFPKDRPPIDYLITHQNDSVLAWLDGATQRNGSVALVV